MPPALGSQENGDPMKLAQILAAIVLPKEISDFERNYLKRMNRLTLWFFAMHIPVFALVAFVNDTNPLLALSLTTLVWAGPAFAYKTLRNPRAISTVYGFTSMLMGGLLVHFGQGPVQIEMHFYFFALLAMLAMYGNPVVIVTAAVTVAVHHLAAWYFIPTSIFNYAAPLWVVLVHAGFVVLESGATSYIARSFFDNVIGLEKIVRARTEELDSRNDDMRLVLDNVGQGFITIDQAGIMSKEMSAIVRKWFGPTKDEETIFDYIKRSDKTFSASLAMGWEQVTDGLLPLETTLQQLPQFLHLGEQVLELSVTPLLRDDEIETALLVFTDVTSAQQQARLEREQRESGSILARIARDKRGFLEYYAESSALVAGITDGSLKEITVLKRALHTLKGNSMIFGVDTVAELCHDLETVIIETNSLPSSASIAGLSKRWQSLAASLGHILEGTKEGSIELGEDQFYDLLHAVLNNASHAELAQMVNNLRLEPTKNRLERVAEQAIRIGSRLNKDNIEVAIEDNNLLIDPKRWATFWSAFIHVVRNAVDHGLEGDIERAESGKEEQSSLQLRTFLDEQTDAFIVQVRDDGRGINWSAIKEKAQEQGVLVGEDKDGLLSALFADGLSTASQVTGISGRGVGMGAVKEACEAQGGKVIVESEDGKGTTVSFHFPMDAMAASPSEVDGRFAAA